MNRNGVVAPSASVPTAHPTLLIAVLSAAGISVSLMQTLIVPLIPELPNLLHTSPSNASWAITATLLTAAVATPVFGRLGDMYGPKPMLVACAVLLIVGSLIAASTSSLLPLIVGRGLQGFGIPIIPLGISVLRSCVPPERVGSAMGLMSASLGVGGALGLPLSAVIAQHFDWRVLFWFATALGVAALVMFVTMVPHVPPRSADRLDPLGALLLAGGLVTLLLGISKGQSWGWASTSTLSMFGSSVLIFAVFGWWQLRMLVADGRPADHGQAAGADDQRGVDRRRVRDVRAVVRGAADPRAAARKPATDWASRCCGPGCGWRPAGWR